MTEAAAYRVLARKYRPSSFAGLIGQEAMVRTLSNSIAAGRLAHAFILTGVRGVGKTTTARIIARALNCTGPDGQGGPTVAPCGTCDSCRAIAEDRHVDVLEMDAASRTGIGDIREIIDSVRYAPASARYKIYIIDEVHMLSTAAFNGLLKTLEEPPGHVKFIFATTEIRKVPVTVLSRCQRFDLKRVEAEVLIAHLQGILAQEAAEAEPEALALIARAAEGSVRDSLSLLDQALAHGAGQVTAQAVREMLGLADRAQVFDLYEQVMRGEIAAALASLRRQYDAGADPAVVLQDMLDLTHWLTRITITPEAADDVTVAETERERGREMARALPMPVLNRTWQMLLKGLGEVRQAAQAMAAAEMVLVRLAYVADLPPPAELVRQLQGQGQSPRQDRAPAAPPGSGPAASASLGSRGGWSGSAAAPRSIAQSEPVAEGTPAAELRQPVPAAPEIPDLEALVALAAERRDPLLRGWLVNYLHPVRFEPGRIEFRPAAGAPPELSTRLGARLQEWTGRRWIVTISAEPGEPTLGQRAAEAEAGRRAELERHPLVRAALEAFPGADIRAVRSMAPSLPDPHMEGDGPVTDLEDEES